MNTFRDDTGFDLKEAKRYTSVYSESVGVESLVIDDRGWILYNSKDDRGFCSFCQRVQGIVQAQNCTKARLYGSYQAERFGGKYVFFCPMGLTYWASPLTRDGNMVGALLGGPVLMLDPSEYLMDDLIRKIVTDENKIAELHSYIREIPLIKTTVVNSLSELLFITASHLSGETAVPYLRDREFQEQQSEISTYLHQMKGLIPEEEAAPGYPLEKEKELLSRIAAGNKMASQKLLNEILGYIFFAAGQRFEVIRARVLELTVLLSRAALEGGADVEVIFGLNYRFLNELHDFQTIDELTYWLSKIMERFTDCVFNLADVKHVDVIFKATNLIKKNYMCKLTLSEVAAAVNLSPSYLSKIFKEETGNTFNSYLNRVRIEAGKRLILSGETSLVDVSNIIGYDDQSYFTKVFKKLTGFSPGKYRESRGIRK